MTQREERSRKEAELVIKENGNKAEDRINKIEQEAAEEIRRTKR